MPGVAARHEDGVDPRQLLEDLGPFGQCVLDGPGIGVIGIHRRVPDPDVQAVVGADLDMPAIISSGGSGKVGAVGGVVRARGDQLDGVGAEDGQIADISLPLRQVPGVVGVGLGTIAELVAAERIPWRRRQLKAAGKATATRARCSSRSSLPTPNSTPRASLPTIDTAGARRRPLTV